MNEIVSYQLVARRAQRPRAVRRADRDRAARRGDRRQPGEGLRRARACCANSTSIRTRASTASWATCRNCSATCSRTPSSGRGTRVLLTVQSARPRQGRRARACCIAVEDDGPGIAGRTVAQLLQRGVRGDERVQGHGIGLAIVQDIVRAYRGELEVERSEELGGARFEVKLPPGSDGFPRMRPRSTRTARRRRSVRQMRRDVRHAPRAAAPDR